MSFRNGIASIDGIAIKGRRIILPTLLQDKEINHLYINYMAIQKARMLAHKSIYLINMNSDIEAVMKNAPHVLIMRPHDPRKKKCHLKYQGGNRKLLELTSLQLITNIIFLL